MTAVMAAMAVPAWVSGVERAHALGAARYVASRFSLARTQAVARGTNVAVALTASAFGVRLTSYRDGNGNGVRTADIALGVDPIVEEPVDVTDLFPGVIIAINNPTAALVPGSTTLMSFTAVGTASSGTIYVKGRDASQYGVRVLGATARTRVLRYLAPQDQWVPVF
jgi:hypothetical protein